ncbi:MAG: type III pantothenate kinase [Bacteroidales bacterium]|nr:type III pantothenate kinase [Bacteroidales bacterium]
MKLLVDIGNTDIKWRLANEEWSLLDEGGVLGTDGWESVLHGKQMDEAIVCASGGDPEYHCEILREHSVMARSFNMDDTLPIAIDYETPQTLGQDRVAAACGAWGMQKDACVVIDAGTCTTVDYIDAHGVFRGGAILPGAEMQLLSLYQNTARLPHVELDYTEKNNPLGHSTREAMKCGVVCGVRYAVQGIVQHYRKADAQVRILYTGGVGEYVCSEIDGAKYEPDLLFKGLATIAQMYDKPLAKQ